MSPVTGFFRARRKSLSLIWPMRSNGALFLLPSKAGCFLCETLQYGTLGAPQAFPRDSFLYFVIQTLQLPQLLCPLWGCVLQSRAIDFWIMTRLDRAMAWLLAIEHTYSITHCQGYKYAAQQGTLLPGNLLSYIVCCIWFTAELRDN